MRQLRETFMNAEHHIGLQYTVHTADGRLISDVNTFVGKARVNNQTNDG